MTQKEQQKLGKTLWNIADDLRGAMNADDFRDYMLSLLFLRYLSSNYEEAAVRESGRDYPVLKDVNKKLIDINKSIEESTEKHNEFLKELGLKTI